LATQATSSEPAPAVRLFRDRARAVRPDAQLPLDIVTDLVARLDGLPLAIELAAARVRALSVEQVAAGLTDRFALLTSSDPTRPNRHRTLVAVFDWSWDLLDATQRRLVRGAAVFPGGITLATAAHQLADPARTTPAAVDGQVLDAVTGLVDQSLLTVDEMVSGGPVRYRMSQMLRQYALGCRGPAGHLRPVAQGLLTWAIAAGEEFAALSAGQGAAAAAELAAAEHNNLAAAYQLASAVGRPHQPPAGASASASGQATPGAHPSPVPATTWLATRSSVIAVLADGVDYQLAARATAAVETMMGGRPATVPARPAGLGAAAPSAGS
jgi:predicted ATPase